MGPVVQGAFAGLIAALVATAILGVAKYVRQWLANGQDMKYIRDILVQAKKPVLEAQDTFHGGMGVTIPADVLRAAQYNYLMRRVSVALEKWALNLSHDQRKDIYDALAWHHEDGLYATNKGGTVQFKELPQGRWPTTEMSKEEAERKFRRLQVIKWLKVD